jgi:hypothetical protein
VVAQRSVKGSVLPGSELVLMAEEEVVLVWGEVAPGRGGGQAVVLAEGWSKIQMDSLKMTT